MKRCIIVTAEYEEFKNNSDIRSQRKMQNAVYIMQEADIIPANIVKKLVNTEFYEMRVSVGKEIRVIIFAIDNTNINLATKIYLLNGFVKKSTKDYRREIERARHILDKL